LAIETKVRRKIELKQKKEERRKDVEERAQY